MNSPQNRDDPATSPPQQPADLEPQQGEVENLSPPESDKVQNKVLLLAVAFGLALLVAAAALFISFGKL